MQQTQTETELATSATFGLLLQPADRSEPLGVVVVGVYPSYTEALGMSLALVFACLVFLKRIDVWVIIIYGGTHSMLQQPLYYCRRTWGATGMEKDFVTVFRDNDSLSVGFT